MSWTYYHYYWLPATGYHISYAQNDGGHSGSITAGKSDTNATITGLIAGSTYFISVVANSSTLPSDPTTVRFNLCMFVYISDKLIVCFVITIDGLSLITSPSFTVAGDNITLTCSLLPSSNSPPDFQWEGPGVNNSTISEARDSSQMTLLKIATSQAGLYTCTATYEMLHFSNTTIITVQSKHIILC